MATTKTTEEKFNGTGSQTVYPFTIEYLATSDLQIFVSNVLQTETTHYSISGSNLTFVTAPESGTGNVRITRSTGVDKARAVYAAGSSVRALDLNANQDQTLFALQERLNTVDGQVSSTAPKGAVNGDRWYDTVSGKLFVYYVDADSAQWVEASPAEPTQFLNSGSGSITRTFNDKLKDVTSVKDYGAKGDGSTDDATAINNALIAATGKTLYFPAGTYIIGAELLPKTGTTIIGDGIESTIIKASSSLATNITLINIVHGQDAVTIKDLRVNGNESNRNSGSGGSNNIMIMSNRNILERVSTINAVNAGILFGSTSDASEENTVSNCIIEDNKGVGLSQSNCSGTIITNNRFARNHLENLTIDAGSNRTICTNNRFFKHFGGVGNIGWDESVDSKICDNFIDNQSDTTASAANRNGICIANQIAGTDPTTHRCIISNNHIVNFKNNGIWLKDTDDSGAVEDAGAFIISNNFVARAASPESGSTDIKIGKTTFKIIIEGNNCEDIDVDDATVTSMWGFSSDVQIGSTKHTVIDQFKQADKDNDRLEPAVFVSATYDGGDLTGDPSAPLGIYAQHELKGSTSTNAYTHSIMGYGLNNSAGDNDAIGTSGRARKKDVTNGIGDAAGVWGSAYQESTKNGGVMAVEGSIYQNVAGTAASDRLGPKWSTSIHLNSDSIGSRALTAIAIDSVGNNSGKYGYWNGIILDGDSFGAGAASAGAAGTVGLNCGSWSDAVGFPEHGIKFGKVKNGITFNSDVATGGYHLYSPSGPIRTFGNLNVTGAILAQSTGDVSLILNADSDDNSTNKGFIDFQINEVVKGNIAINEATTNSPLEINSAVNTNVALVTGGGNVGINNNSPAEKLDVVGNIKASGNIILSDNTKIQLGSSQDLELFHDGSAHSYFRTIAGGIIVKSFADLQFRSDDIQLKSATLENYITCTANGSVELYEDNQKRFETTSSGVNVTGDVVATGAVTAAAGLNAITTSNNTSLVFDADTDNNETGSFNFVDFKIDGALHANIFVDQPASGSGDFEINTHAGVANITKIGNGTGDDRRVKINSDSLQIVTSRSPASNATGEAGQIAWDANYVYVCTATNTWKRAALSTY